MHADKSSQLLGSLVLYEILQSIPFWASWHEAWEEPLTSPLFVWSSGSAFHFWWSVLALGALISPALWVSSWLPWRSASLLPSPVETSALPLPSHPALPCIPGSRPALVPIVWGPLKQQSGFLGKLLRIWPVGLTSFSNLGSLWCYLLRALYNRRVGWCAFPLLERQGLYLVLPGLWLSLRQTSMQIQLYTSGKLFEGRPLLVCHCLPFSSCFWPELLQLQLSSGISHSILQIHSQARQEPCRQRVKPQIIRILE